MKLYKCKMLDESMSDWEECIIAVMESMEEQKDYYRTKERQRFLDSSGYAEYDQYDIEFWFAYEINGYNYAEMIVKNVFQCVCDTYYDDFKFIPSNDNT